MEHCSVQHSLDRFEKRGVTDEDIEKFKGGYGIAIDQWPAKCVRVKVSQLAAFQTFTGNPNKIADLLKMYTSLTKEDVMRAIINILKGKHAVVVSVVTKRTGKDDCAADNYTIDNTNILHPIMVMQD